MLTWTWEAATAEALMGDDDALALLDAESRAAIERARALYRLGPENDPAVAAILAAVEHCPSIRLQ